MNSRGSCSSSCRLLVKILLNDFRCREAIVYRKAGYANKKTGWNDARVGSFPKPVGSFLDHALFLLCKSEDVGETLTSKFSEWLVADGIHDESNRVRRGAKKRCRQIAGLRRRIKLLPSRGIALRF